MKFNVNDDSNYSGLHMTKSYSIGSGSQLFNPLSDRRIYITTSCKALILEIVQCFEFYSCDLMM